jgi:hypothetical protein
MFQQSRANVPATVPAVTVSCFQFSVMWRAGMTFRVSRPTLRSESKRYQMRDNHKVAGVQGQGSGRFGLSGCVWMWRLVRAANYCKQMHRMKVYIIGMSKLWYRITDSEARQVWQQPDCPNSNRNCLQLQHLPTIWKRVFAYTRSKLIDIT